MCCVRVIVCIVAFAVLTDGQSMMDGDKWYWGYVVGRLPPRLNGTITTRLTQEPVVIERRKSNVTEPEDSIPSICLPSYKPPEKPDFSQPGQRIHKTKCFEYIWELNDRIETQNREDICQNYTKEKIPHHKVKGGRSVPAGEFPHMGAIGWKAATGSWIFKCGGSLISEKYVLTAAHCQRVSKVDSTVADVDPKIVRLGSQTLVDNPFFDSRLRNVDKDISKFILHPQYKSPEKYFDIALIELKDTVIFTKVAQPACLWDAFNTEQLGKQANVTGWGQVRSASIRISPDLQAASVDLFELQQCDSLLNSSHSRLWQGFQEHQLCAGKMDGAVDSCKGDSGGPLQVRIPLPKNATDQEGSMHYVIGIVSFGIGCGHPKLPGVYTRVSSFIDWIDDIVWKTK